MPARGRPLKSTLTKPALEELKKFDGRALSKIDLARKRTKKPKKSQRRAAKAKPPTVSSPLKRLTEQDETRARALAPQVSIVKAALSRLDDARKAARQREHELAKLMEPDTLRSSRIPDMEAKNTMS
jgi:hypothetical protein